MTAAVLHLAASSGLASGRRGDGAVALKCVRTCRQRPGSAAMHRCPSLPLAASRLHGLVGQDELIFNVAGVVSPNSVSTDSVNVLLINGALTNLGGTASGFTGQAVCAMRQSPTRPCICGASCRPEYCNRQQRRGAACLHRFRRRSHRGVRVQQLGGLGSEAADQPPRQCLPQAHGEAGHLSSAAVWYSL